MKRLEVLLSKGLEIKGEYKDVKEVISDVKEFSGIANFTNSDDIKASIELKNAKVVDFEGTFIDSKDDGFVIISEFDSMLYPSGEIKDTSSILSKVKKKGLSVVRGDVVNITDNINKDGVHLYCNAITRKSVSDIGVVLQVDEDWCVVSIDGRSFAVPKFCITVNDSFWGKKLSKMVDYTIEKSGEINIGGMLYPEVDEKAEYVEYISPSRIPRFKDNFWDKELRNKYGTKKKIRKALMPMFNCSDEQVDELILMYGGIEIPVTILEGEEINQVFNRENYSNKGTIGSSCMGDKGDLFEIYRDNAKCAIIKSGGKIILRAILWEAHKPDGTPVKFMDRIYSADTKQENIIKAWAIKNGYHHLARQSYSTRDAISPEGKEVSMAGWYVDLKKDKYSKYPYLDTFYYMFSNRLYVNTRGRELKSTTGDSSSAHFSS